MPTPFDFGAWPRLGYADNPLDRAAERRRDDAYCAALCAAPEARCILVGGEVILLKKTDAGFRASFTLEEVRSLAPTDELVFLGLLDSAGCFGAGLDPGVAQALKGKDGLLAIDLRSIATQGLVSAEELAQIAEAKALLHWHARHRFCANCGAPTRITQGGWRRDCPACGAEHFPRTDPVVIMLAVEGERCLLGRQARFAAGMWSCLAGFVEPGESLETAVRRETLEEAGIRCGAVAYFASQPWPFPMSLMIGCYAQALSSEVVMDATELEGARWFHRDEVAQMLLRTHPDGLTTPPSVAIAHHIMRGWVENPHVFG
jgi:NAD+ diphosphatase